MERTPCGETKEAKAVQHKGRGKATKTLGSARTTMASPIVSTFTTSSLSFPHPRQHPRTPTHVLDQIEHSQGEVRRQWMHPACK